TGVQTCALPISLHAFKTGQGSNRRFKRHTDRVRRRDRGQRVLEIVQTGQAPKGLRAAASGTMDCEVPLRRVEELAPPVAGRKTEAFNRRPAAFIDKRLQVRVSRVDDDLAVTRYGAKQLVKLPYDLVDVPVDVGMIELEVIEDDGTGPVVDELCALVKKSGVVFIGFDDKQLRIAESRGPREIPGNPAYQEAGLQSRVLQHEGEHACCSRLAVRSRNGKHVPASQHILGQPLRAGAVG